MVSQAWYADYEIVYQANAKDFLNTGFHRIDN
ncbi:hypothetical protein SAMN04488121_11438 [Chitinophaga filiformis]|uniref:Uncharacterized protein n=1 Tax=Chitinophaga filiformis TaxID=104663 RepID=A0A1G8D9G7_CHIFI|nr:hypothetical protein SAMN04488121_11438 [Chitinophaga filiformis]